jgi:hypothetical protein
MQALFVKKPSSHKSFFRGQHEPRMKSTLDQRRVAPTTTQMGLFFWRARVVAGARRAHSSLRGTFTGESPGWMGNFEIHKTLTIGDLSTREREARSPLPYEHEPAVAPGLGFGTLFRPGKTKADQDFPVPNDFVHSPASSTHHNRMSHFINFLA